VTGSKRYDAFGNLELGAANGYAFTGREWDAETGLFYYRARYYDPKIGRFISEDPIEHDSGEVNFYAYAALSRYHLLPAGSITLAKGGQDLRFMPAPTASVASTSMPTIGAARRKYRELDHMLLSEDGDNYMGVIP
jgi:RHS repeat-associated protein